MTAINLRQLTGTKGWEILENKWLQPLDQILANNVLGLAIVIWRSGVGVHIDNMIRCTDELQARYHKVSVMFEDSEGNLQSIFR